MEFFKRNKVLLLWVALLHIIIAIAFYVMIKLAKDANLTEEYVPSEKPTEQIETPLESP